MCNDIFNSKVFRKCNGWISAANIQQFSQSHQEYFVVPPKEFNMPDNVPKKARCDACEISFRRYKTCARVRRYRLSKKQHETLNKYLRVRESVLNGQLVLPKYLYDALCAAIIENGGSIDQSCIDKE